MSNDDDPLEGYCITVGPKSGPTTVPVGTVDQVNAVATLNIESRLGNIPIYLDATGVLSLMEKLRLQIGAIEKPVVHDPRLDEIMSQEWFVEARHHAELAAKILHRAGCAGATMSLTYGSLKVRV